MTAESIMSFRVVTLKPADKVAEALRIMHQRQIRNLPVVDENGQFVGLFGIRRLTKLLLPKAAQIKGGLEDLSFMTDEKSEISHRLKAALERLHRLKAALERPVSDFLEKKKHLVFCKPSASFPELLELLEQTPDTSLPVIIVKGKKKKLVGMISAWDVLEKLLLEMSDLQTLEFGNHDQADTQK